MDHALARGLNLALAFALIAASPALSQDEEQEPEPTPQEREADKQLQFTAKFRAGLEAITRRDLPASEKLFRECLDLKQNDATCHYNLACTYSLMARVEPAVTSLRAAFQNGFNDLSHMDRDSDLDALRKAPEYRALRGEMEAKVLEGVPAALTRLPAGEGSFPLVVYLHADRAKPEAAFQRLQETLGPEWGILVPQAPLDMRSGRAWDDRAEWLVSQAARELLAANPRADRQRVVVAGEGLAAHRALNLMVHHPDLFTGAVAGGPYLSAGVDAELKAKGRAYLVINQADEAEADSGVEARDRLSDGGAAVVLERYGKPNALQSDRAVLLRALGWATGQPVSLPGAGVELGF